jgi:hypothetical protein
MSLDLYPSVVYGSPDSLGDVDNICQEIHDACEGFGTNET